MLDLFIYSFFLHLIFVGIICGEGGEGKKTSEKTRDFFIDFINGKCRAKMSECRGTPLKYY